MVTKYRRLRLDDDHPTPEFTLLMVVLMVLITLGAIVAWSW